MTFLRHISILTQLLKITDNKIFYYTHAHAQTRALERIQTDTHMYV